MVALVKNDDAGTIKVVSISFSGSSVTATATLLSIVDSGTSYYHGFIFSESSTYIVGKT